MAGDTYLRLATRTCRLMLDVPRPRHASQRAVTWDHSTSAAAPRRASANFRRRLYCHSSHSPAFHLHLHLLSHPYRAVGQAGEGGFSTFAIQCRSAVVQFVYCCTNVTTPTVSTHNMLTRPLCWFLLLPWLVSCTISFACWFLTSSLPSHISAFCLP